MNINDLPDDCLLIIFSELYDLKDLIFCYTVCSKWRDLIKIRLSRVRYILERKDFLKISDQVKSKSLFTHENQIHLYDNKDLIRPSTWPKLSIKCLGPHMLPNLKIINLSPFYNLDQQSTIPTKLFRQNLSQILSNSKSIIGLIDEIGDPLVVNHLGHLEMIVTHKLYRETIIKIKQFKLRQLFLHGTGAKFVFEKCSSFNNLRILSIVLFEYRYNVSHEILFPSLETLIISDYFGGNSDCLQIAFDLIDRCPQLTSCYLRTFQCINLKIDPNERNNQLENLVIQFEKSSNWTFITLTKMLTKYHGLKNLALRQHDYIDDDFVKRIVTQLPNLLTLDLKYCPLVTQSSSQFINNFNHQFGRSINFFFNPSNTKQLSHYFRDPETIDLETNFMGNFFFKLWPKIPSILDCP